MTSAVWNPATTERRRVVPRWQVPPTPIEITSDRADGAMVPQHVPPRRGGNGSGHRNHGARDIKDGTCTVGPTPPSAGLGHFDADNQGLEVKGSATSILAVSRLNLVQFWMHSSRILFGMLVPELCHFAMLCNSPQGYGSTCMCTAVDLYMPPQRALIHRHHHKHHLYQS